MKYIQIGLFSMIATLVASAAAQGESRSGIIEQTESQAEIRVVCVGDSITAGSYPGLLGEMLGEGWVIIKCGKGAATVIEGTLRPYHKLSEYQKALSADPDVVVIMLGTNDSNPKWWDDPQRKTSFSGTPAEEFKARYLTFINSFAALPSAPQILLATPMPVFPEKDSREAMREERIGRRAHLVNDVIPLIREIARERELPLIDLQTLMAEQSENCRDGVHYNKAGYRAMANAIGTEILKLKIPAEEGK
jgi:acyl-CoA thioesterase-1